MTCLNKFTLGEKVLDTCNISPVLYRRGAPRLYKIVGYCREQRILSVVPDVNRCQTAINAKIVDFTGFAVTSNLFFIVSETILHSKYSLQT